jgi:A/G-specific adenine glycosylase
MAVLREAAGAVDPSRIEAAWSEDVQRERALASLLADGLVVARDGGYALPG